MEAARATGAYPDTDWSDHYIGVVRERITAAKRVLDETRNGRRDKVIRGCKSFPGYLRAFASGSLAHGTVNKPVNDADLGLVLDRRHHTIYGPDRLDATGLAPTALMQALGEHVIRLLLVDYPNATFKLTKRAIEFSFNEPLSDDEDPKVDLVICLTRRDKPGFWIPNRDKPRGWDASDPETHTRMMTEDDARALRVFRARLIRLAKAAINNDDEQRVLIPWNISALALLLIREQASHIPFALGTFFNDMGDHIERHGPTADPAGVADPIKLPRDRGETVRRLRFFGRQLMKAVEHSGDPDVVLRELGRVFRKELPEAPVSVNDQVADGLKQSNRHPAVASILGAASAKSERSDGAG